MVMVEFEELKPCPKCNGLNIEDDYDTHDLTDGLEPCETAFIHCLDCKFSTKRYIYGCEVNARELAREEWNKRMEQE